MAIVEEPQVGFARAVGSEDARRRVAHAHRIGVEKSVPPLGRPRQMKMHRRAIGQVAILAYRSVACNEGRSGGQKIEHQQATDRKSYHPRGAAPFAPAALQQRAGARCARGRRARSRLVARYGHGGRHAQSTLNEEKSTRGSTITSAMSASRFPNSNSTVPISTEPITR